MTAQSLQNCCFTGCWMIRTRYGELPAPRRATIDGNAYWREGNTQCAILETLHLYDCSGAARSHVGRRTRLLTSQTQLPFPRTCVRGVALAPCMMPKARRDNAKSNTTYATSPQAHTQDVAEHSTADGLDRRRTERRLLTKLEPHHRMNFAEQARVCSRPVRRDARHRPR